MKYYNKYVLNDHTELSYLSGLISSKNLSPSLPSIYHNKRECFSILKKNLKPSPKKKDTKASPIKEISQKQKENVKVPKNVTFTDKEEVYELHVETEDIVCSNDTDSVLNEDDDIPLSQIQQAAAEIVMHDDMDDIPLSQIKTGDWIVRYRENLEIDTE